MLKEQCSRTPGPNPAGYHNNIIQKLAINIV